MSEWWTLTATGLLERLARREWSVPELVEATLDRIDALDPKLGAFVARAPRDDLAARARDAQARWDRGEARPLEGLPLAVKDEEDVAGFVTTHGSAPFRDDPPAAHDSVQVERLRAAGALVVGKTNLSEFGWTAISKNPLFGVTHCLPA